METVNVPLTPELAELVNAKVANGLYPSATEVIRAGLRLLQEQDEIRRLRLEELRREIERGEASLARGESRVFHSGEELAAHIEAEGRKLLAERKAIK